MPERCGWSEKSDRYREYHDREWGVPLHDDRRLFEFLCLEGAQAGLSWETIFNKREHYRKVFDGFRAEKIARYGAEKIAALLADPGIVRNRAKIEAAIGNARAYLDTRETFGGFAPYLWRFTDGRTIQNRWKTLAEIPAETPEAKAMSKDLKARGFKFVGPTICYAFMQATGMVNDHVRGCFRWKALRGDGSV